MHFVLSRGTAVDRRTAAGPDLRCVVVVDSRRRGSAAMNPSNDALRDLTAFTELKSDGGMLQLHSELLEGYDSEEIVGATRPTLCALVLTPLY